MDCEVRVVSFIGEERGDTGSLARSVVVGELSQRKQFGPVVLLVAAVGAEVLLEGLIDPLGLTIPFRMISRGEVEFHVERCAKAAEEMRDKLRAAVMMLTARCACNRQHTLTGVRSRTAMGCSVGARMGSSRTYRLKRVSSIKMSVTSALQ